MSEHSFDSAPDMGRDFSDQSASYDAPLEHDAQTWEPTKASEIEQPSEKHLKMHLTPGGSLEQAVHSEIDQATRARIAEAQQEQQQQPRQLAEEKELDFAGDFDEARRNAWGWDPESSKEYEALSQDRSDQYDNQPFETGKRFERDSEPERGEDDRER